MRACVRVFVLACPLSSRCLLLSRLAAVSVLACTQDALRVPPLSRPDAGAPAPIAGPILPVPPPIRSPEAGAPAPVAGPIGHVAAPEEDPDPPPAPADAIGRGHGRGRGGRGWGRGRGLEHETWSPE
jgi:hypothetical protein